MTGESSHHDSPGQSIGGTDRPTPYEPAIDVETMADLDGIDLDDGEGCPHCGGRRDNLYCPNAGYYGCLTCGAMWAGDRDNASLMDEPHSGPVRSRNTDTDREGADK